MAQTYKQRTLRACKKQAERYLNPKGEILCDPDYCPFCKMYTGLRCNGCFMSEDGCGSHLTCQSVQAENGTDKRMGAFEKAFGMLEKKLTKGK